MIKGKLGNYSELFDKLKYELELLEKKVTSYNFFNFAVTAYHLIDWIKNSDNADDQIKQQVKELYEDEHFSICKDVCNSCKHFKITRYTPKVNDIESKTGYGCGRYGKGVYGAGEESIYVITKTGQKYDGLDLARAILKTWDDFFREHELTQ